LIAAVTKDPVSETIRVCWDAGLSECDVLIPLVVGQGALEPPKNLRIIE
jgi:hypothetical protein